MAYILMTAKDLLERFLRILLGFVVDMIKSVVLLLFHLALFVVFSFMLVEQFPNEFVANYSDPSMSENISVLPPDTSVSPNMSILPDPPTPPMKSSQPEPSLSFLGGFLLIIIWGMFGYSILPIKKRLLQWRL